MSCEQHQDAKVYGEFGQRGCVDCVTPPKPTTQPSTELEKILGNLTKEAWTTGTENKPFDQVWFEALDARRAILTLIDQAVLDGRIDELRSFIQGMNRYDADYAYERVPFYTVTDRDYQDRIAELQGLSNKEKGNI